MGQYSDYGAYDQGFVAFMVTMWLFFLFFILLASVLMMFSLYKIFVKAGREDAWAAFIPIYNTIVFLDVIKRPWWQIFMYLIPIYGIYLSIVDHNRLSKFFGRSESFTVGLVLLPILFFPILGFGADNYIPHALPDLRDESL